MVNFRTALKFDIELLKTIGLIFITLLKKKMKLMIRSCKLLTYLKLRTTVKNSIFQALIFNGKALVMVDEREKK